MPKHDNSRIELLKTWVLPPAATLGSSVRMKGILLEIRARLPSATKKSLNLDGPAPAGPPAALPIQGFAQAEYRRQFDLMPGGREFLVLMPLPQQ